MLQIYHERLTGKNGRENNSGRSTSQVGVYPLRLISEPVRAWYQQDNEVKVIQLPDRKKLGGQSCSSGSRRRDSGGSGRWDVDNASSAGTHGIA